MIGASSKGFVAAAAAFAIWGLFPLYFHLLQGISAVQVIAHRVVWSCVFVLAWLVALGVWLAGLLYSTVYLYGWGLDDDNLVRRATYPSGGGVSAASPSHRRLRPGGFLGD